MGLGACNVHDVQSVDRLVAGVDVSLKHDHILSKEYLWSFWIQVMFGGDVGEAVGENTTLRQNVVFEQEFGGLGAEDFIKGGEFPVPVFDVKDSLFKLRCSIFFVELSGAKQVELEESVEDFPTGGEVGCIGFAEVLREKCSSFGDCDVGVHLVEG